MSDNSSVHHLTAVPGAPAALESRARTVAPEFKARIWQPGQSGNPSGYGKREAEVRAAARERSPRAIERLGELMEDQDGRVAIIAANSILERAYGRPREMPEEPAAHPLQGVDLSRLNDADLAALYQVFAKLAGSAAGSLAGKGAE